MPNPAVPTKWLPMAVAADVLEGKATLVKHRRQALLIFRRPEGWTAFDNTCPHAGAPMYPEHIDGQCITCVPRPPLPRE